jgi:uncharacterized protein (TIGR02677 family)
LPVTSVFEYIRSENAPLYRGIMRVFIESKDRFVVQLRLQAVIKGLGDIPDLPEHHVIESALAQLCEWGNLEPRPDTSSVCSVEDFYNPPHTFQMTRQGEAFERTLAFYDANSEREHVLQNGCLTDIRFVAQELKQFSQQPERNAAPIYRSVVLLFALFEDLSAVARTLIQKLDGRADLQPPDVRRLVEHSRRLLGELEQEAPVIGQLVRDIESAGLEQLILVVVRRNMDADKSAMPKTIADACNEWRLRWERFRSWFISLPDHRSGLSLLRERLRASLPALLRMSAGIQIEGAGRIDRIQDFRILAKWFAQSASDAEAHVLWRAAFGLSSARHLLINESTLAEREAQDIPAHTSWLEAPPLRIADSECRGSSRTDGLSRIIDRSIEKERLAATCQEETRRLLSSQNCFGNGNRIRLSDLQQLAPCEFELFLDLLGDAVSARVSPADAVEILSGDGCLRVRLEPAGDDHLARIDTGDGALSGPDLWIRIEQIATEDLPEVVR